MGGGSYSKDWSKSYNSSNFPIYTCRLHNVQFIFDETKNDTLSLEDLVEKYTNSKVHERNYSLSSNNEIKEFFKLVDNILTAFKKINKTQAQLLEDKFKQIKSLYRHYKLSIINSYYIGLNSRTKLESNNKGLSIGIDLSNSLKMELDNFIYWLDNILQVYDLLPEKENEEYTDGR